LHLFCSLLKGIVMSLYIQSGDTEAQVVLRRYEARNDAWFTVLMGSVLLACLTLILGLMFPETRYRTAVIALLGLALTAALIYRSWRSAKKGYDQYVSAGRIVSVTPTVTQFANLIESLISDEAARKHKWLTGQVVALQELQAKGGVTDADVAAAIGRVLTELNLQTTPAKLPADDEQ
jgi:hypothetical protein